MQQDPKIYGHIPGIAPGHKFGFRDDLLRAGVHGQARAGIHGDSSPNGGAFSICLSGGYEDNDDRGDRITYVGSGGQHPETGEQIANQSFDDIGNKALSISCQTKRPVRVVRGKDENNTYAPAKGYRYDGLYVVDSATMRRGKKGYNMCFFELRRIKEFEEDRPVPNRRTLTSKKLADMLRKAPKD